MVIAAKMARYLTTHAANNPQSNRVMPPCRFSRSNQWRQQHAQRDDSTVHAILRHVPNRLVRLLDGFNYAEQWLTLLPKFSDMDSSWEPPTLLEMPPLND